MIKYFHELIKEEYKKLVDSKEYTYERLAKEYPQPPWCDYPDATGGVMGCWSLMGFMVKNKEYCKDCECQFMFDDCLPIFFRTRNLARIYCNCRFGYIKHRKDLRTEPHGWRVPRAIKVRITIEELPR